MACPNYQCTLLTFGRRRRGCWIGERNLIIVEKTCSNIFSQAFSPAKVIFTGIGVLLLVWHSFDFPAEPILTSTLAGCERCQR